MLLTSHTYDLYTVCLHRSRLHLQDPGVVYAKQTALSCGDSLQQSSQGDSKNIAECLPQATAEGTHLVYRRPVLQVALESSSVAAHT